ncbi:MAG: formylglycine-generating enzyme family protein [Myxococcales bacterium]|nr:formylglycine-generating enzyme family protein [Myxococcales bacterium]
MLSALALLDGTDDTAAEAVARLPDPPNADLWALVSETFIGLPGKVDARVRLALVDRLLAELRADTATRPRERVERYGRLLAAVDAARQEGAGARATARRYDAIVDALRVAFPLPGPVEALRGPMVALSGGSFEMGRERKRRGTPHDQAPAKQGRARKRDRGDRDERRVRVAVAPFALAATEVTAGRFRALLPEHRPGDADDWPAQEVSWYAAAAYAAWVGARLPTEAEWEYACRDQGRATGRYCSGDSTVALAEITWLDDKQVTPRPVASKAPCGGLHDMHGSVWEWTADRYRRDLRTPPSLAESSRVRRGGMERSHPRYRRCAERSQLRPSAAEEWVGFRLASDVRAP